MNFRFFPRDYKIMIYIDKLITNLVFNEFVTLMNAINEDLAQRFPHTPSVEIRLTKELQDFKSKDDFLNAFPPNFALSYYRLFKHKYPKVVNCICFQAENYQYILTDKDILCKKYKRETINLLENSNENIQSKYTRKAVKRFSEVFREDALKDYEVCEILGISRQSLSVLKGISKKNNKTMSMKSILITRLIKNLHPSIIKFMLNDIYI